MLCAENVVVFISYSSRPCLIQRLTVWNVTALWSLVREMSRVASGRTQFLGHIHIMFCEPDDTEVLVAIETREAEKRLAVPRS